MNTWLDHGPYRKALGAALIVCALVLVGCSRTAVPPQNPPAPSPEPAALVPTGVTAVRMFDEASGWALTKTGVLHMDGGQWRDVSPQLASGTVITKGAFLDAHTAWLTTAQKNSAKVTVWRTADGGHTWAAASIETADSSSAVFVKTLTFADARNGWLLLSYGVGAGSEQVAVYLTGDGGAKWALPADVERQQSFPRGGLKSGLSFADAQHGWMTGRWYGDDLWLYATQDGGHTWSRQTLAAPVGIDTAAGAAETRPPLFFGGDGLLPVTGSANGQTVVFYVTRDQGRTWQATTAVKSEVNKPFVWSFADAQHGFVTDGHKLYFTGDSGRTWTAVQTGTDLSPIEYLFFVSPRTGWAVMGGELFKTVDGGRTWQQ